MDEIEVEEVKDEKPKFRLTDQMIEPVYKRYPRREGKRTGFERLKARIKSEDKWNDFIKSVDNYAKLCQTEGRTKKYTLMFETFCNVRWEDYIDVGDSSFGFSDDEDLFE